MDQPQSAYSALPETPASAGNASPRTPPPAPPVRPCQRVRHSPSEAGEQSVPASLPAPSAERSPLAVPCLVPAANSQCLHKQSAAPAPQSTSGGAGETHTLPAGPEFPHHPASAPRAPSATPSCPAPSKTPSAWKTSAEPPHLPSPRERPSPHPALPGQPCKANWSPAHERMEHSRAPASSRSADNNPEAYSSTGLHRIPSAPLPLSSLVWYSPTTCCRPPNRHRQTHAAKSDSSSPPSPRHPGHRQNR